MLHTHRQWLFLFNLFAVITMLRLIVIAHAYQQQQQQQQQQQRSAQFVEFYTDYKKNHIEDAINYAYRYYIDDFVNSKLQLDHSEQRHGTRVLGYYGLLEPNGNVRNVHYEVDGNKGFRAIVQTRTAASRTLQRFHHLRRPQQQQQPIEPVRHAEPVAYVL